MKNEPPLLVICGPTGAGKTALALVLARRLGGEIISADAFQFYRGLDIGTDKPARADLRLTKHHFVDCLSPADAADAHWFASRVRALLPEIRERGAVPIMVGGSGLYLRAALEWFFEVPDDGAIRAARARVALLPPCTLHHMLAEVDPESARRVHPNDHYRLRRALEVFSGTGKPISAFRRRNVVLAGRHLQFGVWRPRGELYRRIDARVEQMFRTGLVEEVRGLRAKYDFSLPAFSALGYREIAACLENGAPLDEAGEAIKRKTRHYARRQMTWLMKQPGVVWLDFSGRP